MNIKQCDCSLSSKPALNSDVKRPYIVVFWFACLFVCLFFVRFIVFPLIFHQLYTVIKVCLLEKTHICLYILSVIFLYFFFLCIYSYIHVLNFKGIVTRYVFEGNEYISLDSHLTYDTGFLMTS